jgi:hemoglobin
VSARLPIVAAEGGARDEGRGASASSPAAHRDLEDADLHDLLVAFYDDVAREPLLAPYFAPVDMTAHIPVIADFWSTLLFHTGRYAANAFRPHAEMPGLTAERFGRWLAVLEATVDARFAGPNAERMKVLGHRVAFSMQVRLGIEPHGA